MLHLPIEILRHILDLATYVPNAFNTSFEAIEGEDRDHVLQLIHQSLITKTILSCVSKELHFIMESLLYEIVVIFRFRFVPILLERLRTMSGGQTRTWGHTCRRLDIYLGVGSDAGYLDESWNEGGHTLWGLIPTCPRLEVLLVRVVCQDGGSRPKSLFPAPHLTHNCLWKTISSFCAGTLRRLELFGFSIRMDRVEMMLRYMTALEACHIFHCTPFYDLDYWDSRSRGNWMPDTHDDEEPTSRVYYRSRPGRVQCEIGRRKSLEFVQSQETEGTPSGWFDHQIRAEFEAAKANTVWPPYHGGPAPYILPKLHSLHLMLTPHFFEFILPSLRSFSTTGISEQAMFFIRNTDAAFAYGVPPSPSAMAIGDRSHSNSFDKNGSIPASELRKNNPNYKYFPKPDLHSTIFGTFPVTITHLSMRRYVPLNQVLDRFPNVTHLTWDIHFTCNPPATISRPHTALQQIAIRNRCLDDTSLLAVNQVLEAAKKGWLVKLKEIRCSNLTKDRTYLPRGLMLPYEKSKELGVALSDVLQKGSRLDCFCEY
ncbi:hypothetical protein DXG01_013502 [Tephrocybe rancida]|nr:hypothetical protein DXG01_013502 [Tephrocybe rancida]